MNATEASTPGVSWLRTRRLARAGAALGVSAALFVAAAGFLHTSAGRPLLARLSSGKCPFGQSRGKLSPTRREELRRAGLTRLVQVQSNAPARPALGFELGSVHESEVVHWAAVNGLACTPESQGAGLSCKSVSGALLGEAGDHRGNVSFRFDQKQRLVSVLRMVHTREPEAAVALADAEQRTLRERMGAPTRANGELSLSTLASGPLRQARFEHRYRDFSALVSVTNMGAEGYLITEEAQLLD